MRRFFRRTRNLYFSVAIMLCLVVGLSVISYSYYVSDSSNGSKNVSLKMVNNELYSSYLNKGKIELQPYQTLNIELKVVSHNDFDSSYKIGYATSSSSVDVYSTEFVENKLNAGASKSYNVVIENKTSSLETVDFKLYNGYLNSNINVSGNILSSR